ncbi:MAG: dTMP kinase [Deltaproteobacteria bacterium]|nr:dTMP kinase [Deltaproteobacteria bacterium]
MKKSFFCIDGPVGAGKSSVVNKLKYIFPDFFYGKEPGCSKIGEICRSLILNTKPPLQVLTQFWLVLADRSEYVEVLRRIQKPIISDRYYYSTIAYWGAGWGYGEDFVESICLKIVQDIVPEKVFILDIESDLGRKRKLEQGPLDNLDGLPLEFHDKARHSFLRQARKNPERFAVIDTSEKSIEDVVEIIVSSIKDVLTC